MSEDQGLETPDTGGTSGDPLLKRLVDLAQLGFQPDLVILTNGEVIRGVLVSARTYRTALANSIRAAEADDAYAALEELVATAIEKEDPGPSGMGAPSDVPEPRYIHLANVRLGRDAQPFAPFLRLRLPAVSGFWLESSPRVS
jgi:hypothetical protein